MDVGVLKKFLKEHIGKKTKLKTHEGKTFTISKTEKITKTQFIFFDVYGVLVSINIAEIESLWGDGMVQ